VKRPGEKWYWGGGKEACLDLAERGGPRCFQAGGRGRKETRSDHRGNLKEEGKRMGRRLFLVFSSEKKEKKNKKPAAR